MKVLATLATVSFFLASPQIIKSDWTSIKFETGSIQENLINNQFAEAVTCFAPIRLISKHETFIDSKMSIDKILRISEC
jgi:CRISPR/Cas system CMR-associated protein Cmr5 small subunit